jgi:cysteine desulfurase
MYDPNLILRRLALNRIYMDYAATTPVHQEVLEAMQPVFHDYFGNPSSIHSFGLEAKKMIDQARQTIADFVGARPEEIVFTSGGTESDNFAIKGTSQYWGQKKRHIITTAIEHHAVLETCHFMRECGFDVTILPVDRYGWVDPDSVKKALTPQTFLVSIMHASNEVGTIQPIEEIGLITREAGVCLHTDAVQTFGHLPIDVQSMNVDLLSISGHKLYGPKGVGVLYVRKGSKINPFMHGGGQEDGRRGGTYNTPAIVGLGKAVEIAHREMEHEGRRITALRERLIQGLLEKIELTKLNGHPVHRLPNNINVSMAFVEGEATLLSLDLAGIAASTGSACSSESSEPSHVLSAMSVPAEEARCSIRFSLGKWTTEKDVDNVLNTLPGIIAKLREMSPLYKIRKK